jgi:VIT1/CCC1 family predicted Fe2+/Mn2+ transporter
MMRSQKELLNAQAELLIDEHENCKAVMNGTVFSVGVVTLGSLVLLLAFVQISPSNPLWSYILGGLSAIFVIGTAPMWQILSKPKYDVVTISSEAQRDRLLNYHKSWFQKKWKKSIHEGDWQTTLIRRISIYFTKDLFMWLGGVFFIAAWVLSVIILIIMKYEQMTSIFFVLFSLSILAFSLLGLRTGLDYSLSRRLVNVKLPLWGLFSWGICIIPTKLRAGDSHSVLIGFERVKDFKEKLDELLSLTKATPAPHLEAELQAKGAEVNKDIKNRRLCMDSETATALWNCNFPNRGRHEIDVILSVVHPSSDTEEMIFAYKHTVKVEGLLIATWQPVLTIMLSVLTAVIGISRVH